MAVDGNFKLKGKDRKLQDVNLIGSSGVFVDDAGYHEHIKNYKDQPEVCLSYQSLYLRTINNVDQHLSIRA